MSGEGCGGGPGEEWAWTCTHAQQHRLCIPREQPRHPSMWSRTELGLWVTRNAALSSGWSGPLNICWSLIHGCHRFHTCPDRDLLLGSITFSCPPCPGHGLMFTAAPERCSRCGCVVNGTRCRNGAEMVGWDGWDGWVGGKHRPPSVALCAAIGEAPQGDCATDGHLQATMLPFVQPLPSLKITYPTIDSDLWQGDRVAMILRVCADASH